MLCAKQPRNYKSKVSFIKSKAAVLFVNKAYKKDTLACWLVLVTAGDLAENGLLNTISTAFLKKAILCLRLKLITHHNRNMSRYGLLTI